MLQSPKRNLFLIGPMGSGKTAVGRELARLLQIEFHDSDLAIEHRTGVDIPYIFEREGEAGFRERERDAIEALTALDNVVVATGGGAVLLSANRACLAARGLVVYLRTSVDQQIERTRHGKHRPLLLTADPRAKLIELLEKRAPLYESIADFVVETDGRHVREVAEQILEYLQQPSSGPIQPLSE